ncbi:unnamed protein product [Trifolium pratense]|uniref:Uncharacterized protein n=1 Tax=Trifolium pratense TaxID=57577 RepID=A0ACB0JZJ7_TRIPR|nr:unnamed protein product [Trifolium pratense]
MSLAFASNAISLSYSILQIRSNYDSQAIEDSMICSRGMSVEDDYVIISAVISLIKQHIKSLS